MTDHSTDAVDRGAQGRPEDCKIKARDACATLSKANTLSERWVRTAFARAILARHEARLTEERKSFNAVERCVIGRTCKSSASTQSRAHGPRRRSGLPRWRSARLLNDPHACVWLGTRHHCRWYTLVVSPAKLASAEVPVLSMFVGPPFVSPRERQAIYLSFDSAVEFPDFPKPSELVRAFLFGLCASSFRTACRPPCRRSASRV